MLHNAVGYCFQVSLQLLPQAGGVFWPDLELVCGIHGRVDVELVLG